MRAYRTFQQDLSSEPGPRNSVKKLAYLFISLGSLYFNNLYAVAQPKTLNYSSGVGTPITTSTADSLDKGDWSFSGRSEYYRLNPLSDRALLEDTVSESQLALSINYFMINYGMTDNLTIGATLPFIHSYELRAAVPDEEESFSKVANLGNISGIADANLFAFWHVLDDDNQFPLSTALVFGINAPTGRTHAMTNNGVLFSAADQPGTGTWSPFAGIVFSKKVGDFSLDADCTYTQTTKGIQATTLGKVLDYDFAVVYPLVAQNKERKLNYSIDGVVELNGEYISQDKIAGIKDPDSGGHSLFFSPGFRINLADSVSFYLGVGIPITETLRGTQAKSKYGVIGGIDLVL